MHIVKKRDTNYIRRLLSKRYTNQLTNGCQPNLVAQSANAKAFSEIYGPNERLKFSGPLTELKRRCDYTAANFSPDGMLNIGPKLNTFSPVFRTAFQLL